MALNQIKKMDKKNSSPSTEKNFKHLDTLVALFIAILLISNIVTTKIVKVGPLTLDGGTFIFFISYIFGDILTEVYGFKKSRKVIWLGFFANLLLSLIIYLIGILPSAADWPHQQAYETILGITPRIVAASLIAYLCGEFANAMTLAKLKIVHQGKKLWIRTIGSTLVGQAIDSFIFITIAFYGILPESTLITLIISNYIFKCFFEIIATPITYKIVNFLKKSENEDYFDYNTKFNPFTIN